jgi:hypothetical protein
MEREQEMLDFHCITTEFWGWSMDFLHFHCNVMRPSQGQLGL